MVVEAEMRVKAVTEKTNLVPVAFKEAQKETGALQAESFFHQEEHTLQTQVKATLGQEAREVKWARDKALVSRKEKPVEQKQANIRH
jgi:hypothetical protein